jgi:hypothetical protein
VDAIINKNPGHKELVNPLALVHGIAKKGSNCLKYIVRDEALHGKRITYKNDDKKREERNIVSLNLTQQCVLERKYRLSLSLLTGKQIAWSKDDIKELVHKVGLSKG